MTRQSGLQEGTSRPDTDPVIHNLWAYLTMNDDRALADSFRQTHYVITWPPRDGSEALGGVFIDL
ncbi:MAG: hypothetical protein WEB67_10970 [Acidimicrobiia bacterium]